MRTSKPRKAATASAAFALAALTASAAAAQAVSTAAAAAASVAAPSTATAAVPVAPAAAPAAPVAARADAGSIKLAALLFVQNSKAVLSAGTPKAEGVEIKVSFLKRRDFKALMADFLGKPLTEATRSAVVAATVQFYRDHGRPIVDVSLPPQELTGGVLQVLVRQGKVGKIKVEGSRWFSPEYISSQLHAQPGEDIDAEVLGNDLDWINRNPFRQVDLVYVKGSELDQTDLVLREVDSFPVRFYTGFEDSGTESTGENRLLAGLNWGNVLGLDGQMNYQYMADPEFKWFRAHSGSFIQPLPWRHTLTVFGSYADTHGDVAQLFNLSGFNEQASIRYEVPLPTLASAELSYTHSLVAGFDFKRANNNLAFGGTQVFGAITDTLQWNFGYDSSLKDPWGETTLRGTIFYSPGHWTDNDTDAAYNLSRAGATSRYTYANFELDRTTGLPWDFMLVNRGTFQLSDSNLLASEQLGFGGYDTIRGYDTRVVNADSGYILSTEVRTPPISVLPYLRVKGVQDKLQFLGFFDYGSGSNRNLLAGEQSQTVLAGIGPGLRYSVSTHFSLRADYGWQLHDAQPSRPYASRADFGVVLSY